MPTKAPTLRRPRKTSQTPAFARQDDRASAARRGYGREHRKWRLAVLRRDPFCVLCRKRDRIEAATVADHVRPITAGGERFDVDNGRGLCAACHARVTARYRATGINELPRQRSTREV